MIARWLADRARNTPQRVAIDYDGRFVTYAELAAGAGAFAAAFAESGLRRGDRVATLTGNSPEHVMVLFACAQLGLILLPLSWRLTAPDRVERLVLVSTAPGGPKAHPMPASTVEVFATYPTMEREAGLRMFVENSLGARGVRELPELVEEILRYRLERAPTVDAWLAQAAAGATFDSYDRVGEISAPTLVVHGDADVVVDPRNGALLGELIDGARVEVVPDRGHLLVWEDSQRVAELVTEFLA